MSLLFLNLTILSYLFSHWWAKQTAPLFCRNHATAFLFDGNLEEFKKALIKQIEHTPGLSMVRESPHYFLISSRPTWLSFGSYYHVEYQESSQGVYGVIALQPKLVATPLDHSELSNSLPHKVEWKDAG